MLLKVPLHNMELYTLQRIDRELWNYLREELCENRVRPLNMYVPPLAEIRQIR